MNNDVFNDDKIIDLLVAEALQIKEEVNDKDIEMFLASDLSLSSEEQDILKMIDDLPKRLLSDLETPRILEFPSIKARITEEDYKFCVGFNRKNDDDIQDEELKKKLEKKRNELLSKKHD